MPSTLAPARSATAGRAHRPAPESASTVPPRRAVPEFPTIRRGGGGRHRLQQAVRHRPGVLVTGLLAAATALAAGPLRPGTPVPAPPTNSQTIAGASGAPRCTASR